MKCERVKKAKSYKDLIDIATVFFGYDKDKALNWYMTKRPEFDNKTPFEMCKQGHTEKLIKAFEKLLLVQ